MSSFFSSISVSWESTVASGWKCKAEGTQGLAMLPWPRCKTGHSGLWYPLGNWRIWGDISKALCENRQQNTHCGVQILTVQRERKRGHQEDGLMHSLSLSICATLWGFEFLGPSLSWSEGVHQRRSYNVALPAADATLPFISLTARALQNRLQTQGHGLYNLGYEICLAQASTSRNLS